MCLAQGHNAVMPVRPEPTATRSRVKHSTTELPLVNLIIDLILIDLILIYFRLDATGLEITSEFSS